MMCVVYIDTFITYYMYTTQYRFLINHNHYENICINIT